MLLALTADVTGFVRLAHALCRVLERRPVPRQDHGIMLLHVLLDGPFGEISSWYNVRGTGTHHGADLQAKADHVQGQRVWVLGIHRLHPGDQNLTDLVVEGDVPATWRHVHRRGS